MRNHLPGILCRGYRRREEAKVKAEKDKKKKLQKEAEEKNVAGDTDVSVKKEGTATTGEVPTSSSPYLYNNEVGRDLPVDLTDDRKDRAVQQWREWAAEQRPRGLTRSQQSREPSSRPATDAAPKSSEFDPLEEFSPPDLQSMPTP